MAAMVLISADYCTASLSGCCGLCMMLKLLWSFLDHSGQQTFVRPHGLQSQGGIEHYYKSPFIFKQPIYNYVVNCTVYLNQRS